jgi:hypothetical protein
MKERLRRSEHAAGEASPLLLREQHVMALSLTQVRDRDVTQALSHTARAHAYRTKLPRTRPHVLLLLPTTPQCNARRAPAARDNSSLSTWLRTQLTAAAGPKRKEA